MKKQIIIIIIEMIKSIFITCLVSVSAIYIIKKYINIDGNYVIFFGVLVGAVSVGLFWTFNRIFYRNINQRNEYTHNIAVIGMPLSGKTTIITTLFGGIMYGRISMLNYKAQLKGNSTIEMVNQNLSKLERGIPVGSTNNQTIFSYRFNIEEKSKSFFYSPKKFNVEIADFQGELTKELIDQDTLIFRHDSDYFNWIKDAHAYIFIVDLGSYKLDPINYVPEISKVIRTSWQKILDLNSLNESNVRLRKVVLVFNKLDITLSNYSINDIYDLAYTKDDQKLPKILNSVDVYTDVLEITRDFDNLIKFLDIECRNFSYTFYSSFITNKYEYRMGINNISNKILP